MRRAVEVVALSRSDAEYMQQHLQQPGAGSSGAAPKVRALPGGLPACLTLATKSWRG
jgi:hypothetical protein